MTNKKEWDSFVRSNGRFKVHDFFSAQKVECFNLWLDSGKSWDTVKLKVERMHAESVESTRGWVAQQGKDIRKNHSDEKAEAIFKARKASGLWYPSEDFPDDDDDTSIIMQLKVFP